MIVRRAGPGDEVVYAELRVELWPGIPSPENLRECREVLAAADQAVLLAETPRGQTVGFAEVSLRPLAEGCSTRPVGYLEGWYVRPDARHRGVGRRLMEAAELWARERGCTEMASDTEVGNIASEEAHQRLGYTIVGRIVTFRKSLT
jgi:aminoglycoside 6'-N-acetyltransferase I